MGSFWKSLFSLFLIIMIKTRQESRVKSVYSRTKLLGFKSYLYHCIMVLRKTFNILYPDFLSERYIDNSVDLTGFFMIKSINIDI
jgi:hypothetical protein